MALNIKSRETEEVVRELAKRTGLSITDAVHQAASEKLAALKDDRESRRRALYEIIERARTMPNLDPRSDEEIIGYNEYGAVD